MGTQLASTIMMSASQTDPNMRRVMMFMPLIFVLVVIRFPAGVLVYWITTNTWTIGQQYIVKQRMGPMQAATAAAAASATGRRGRDEGRPADRGWRPDDERTRSTGEGLAAGQAAAPVRRATGKAGEAARERLGQRRPRSHDPQQGPADEKPEPVATAQRAGPPPKSPRKKKKRSGRRR